MTMAAEGGSYVIGIDTGGTFTDCTVIDADGQIHIAKSPTTPGRLLDGILGAVGKAAAGLGMSREDLLRQTAMYCQGSTIATNTLLTRTGAKTGLVTTRGFEEAILFMRTKGRFAGYDEEEIKHVVHTRRPLPLVPRALIHGVSERIDYQGRVLAPLDEAEVRQVVSDLLADGVEAIAVSLLWSFANPSHEQTIRRIIEEISPQTFVSLSSEVAPRIGEYERTATTVINAYIGDVNRRFVNGVVSGLAEQGFRHTPQFAQAYGGTVPPDAAIRRAVGVISSGPTSGVMAARHLAQVLGYENVITTDVGGTSFDVGVIYQGNPTLNHNPIIGQYELLIPFVEVQSIGAGGGSIAWVEPSTGVLKVGPMSAGADPGPVCYARGGTQPTVTDADLVMGILDPEYFLGGDIRLDKALARQAITEHLAGPLGITPEEAAAGVFEVANAHMADLVRLVTVGRGYDPRDFVVFAYGGGGPVRAAFYGRQAREIIVPFTAAVHSSLGTVVSDIQHLFELSDPQQMPFDVDRLNAHYEDLEERARRELEAAGFGPQQMSFERYVDMKYARQAHELRVPLNGLGRLTANSLEQLVSTFESHYEMSYGKGTGHREAGVELVTTVVRGIGLTPKPRLRKLPHGGIDPSGGLKGRRPVYVRSKGDHTQAQVYELGSLHSGNVVRGMAIIEAPTTTIFVDEGQDARIDEYGNVRITMR